MSRSNQIQASLAAVFIAAMVLGLVWLQRRSLGLLTTFQREFVGVQVETFRLADHIKARVRELNDLAVNYQLHGQVADRQRAEALSRELQAWLQEQAPLLRTTREAALMAEIRSASGTYLATLQDELDGPPKEAGTDHAAKSMRLFDRLTMESGALLGLADRLDLAQKASAKALLTDFQETVTDYELLVTGKSVLFVLMGAGLAAAVYLGLIAPLQARVRLSRTILERQEKLAALSTLVAGLAHEIRNPLNSIKARLFTQAKDLPRQSDALQDNRFIAGEIARLDEIIQNFLRFARPSDLALAVIPASGPFRELAELMRAGLEKSRISLRTEFLAEPLIEADPNQLKQALLNLAKNAAEAVGQDGTITFRTRSVPGLARTGHRAEAILEVEDSGQGIPPAAQARLFDPFFTTKEVGTGLGLSTAARIVEKHGGRIEYQSKLNHGSTFRVVLPVANSHEHSTNPPD